MDITIDYTPNKKQYLFHSCGSDEVVYGGAKGGGKSCALIMESLAYALENPGAEVYLFRETYDDLEANLIKEWKSKVPKEIQSHPFNNTNYYATLKNGSVIKFRYIRSFQDAESYQGRSIDFIGIDELTKHEYRSVQILLSCLRSPKGFKPVFKATCNPGGIGHNWVKEMFVDETDYGKKVANCPITGNTRSFIPATVYDNDILMKNDPNYVKRLENLPENEKKAFLHGDWDIFDGQYFKEFSRKIHVIEPFNVPLSWKRYLSIDYGLDMLAVLWYAIDENGTIYAYKELHESDLIISSAAQRLLEVNNGERYECIYAPGDLWNRRQDTGKSAFDIFAESGVHFVKAKNTRVDGWYSVREWLKVVEVKDEQTGELVQTSSLKITSNCTNLCKNLPKAQHDDRNPNDVSNNPHDITHILDALRYMLCMRQISTARVVERSQSDVINERLGAFKNNAQTIDMGYINYG